MRTMPVNIKAEIILLLLNLNYEFSIDNLHVVSTV